MDIPLVIHSLCRMDIPERELKRVKYDRTAPVRTPTLVGCAFSIDRDFFYEIGSYDEKMDIWGSENMEMSLRVWQCGGLMEVVPCSHVGHLYRVSTYSFNGVEHEIKNRNNVRVVDVWMDEYKDYFYGTETSKCQLQYDATKKFRRTLSSLRCKENGPGRFNCPFRAEEKIEMQELRMVFEEYLPREQYRKHEVPGKLPKRRSVS